MNYFNLVLAGFLFAAVSASPVTKAPEHHMSKNETSGHLNATTHHNATTEAPLLGLNVTTPAPGLNRTMVNGTTPAPALNETLGSSTMKPNATITKRAVKDCQPKDLTKIESDLALFLEQELERLFNGSVDLGLVKKVKTNGHQEPEDLNGAPGGGPGGAPSGEDITVQNVGAISHPETGSSVAQALSKRATTISQNVNASANNAVSNAEIHKGGKNNLQSVGSSGTQSGISTALINNTKGGALNMQDVSASGKNAAAAATINKAGEKNIQNALSVGEETAISSISIGSGPSSGSHPLHEPKKATCTPVKLDENVREYIRHTVAVAMKQLKKELEA